MNTLLLMVKISVNAYTLMKTLLSMVKISVNVYTLMKSLLSMVKISMKDGFMSGFELAPLHSYNDAIAWSLEKDAKIHYNASTLMNKNSVP